MSDEISLHKKNQKEATFLPGSHPIPNAAEEAVDDAKGQAYASTITEASTLNTALGNKTLSSKRAKTDEHNRRSMKRWRRVNFGVEMTSGLSH